MSDNDLSERQKNLEDKMKELLQTLYGLPKQFLEEESMQKLREKAALKIKVAAEAMEVINLDGKDSLLQKNMRLGFAEKVVWETADYIGILSYFISEMEDAVSKRAENMKKAIDKVMKYKSDDGSDEWVRILHLSDLHFGYYNYSPNITASQDKEDYLRVVKDALFRFLKEYITTKNRIDIVAITGDISYANDSKGYQDFSVWIEELCSEELLDINIRHNVIMCPGNHDSGYDKRSDYGIVSNEEADKNSALRKNSVGHVLSKDRIADRAKQFEQYNEMCANLQIGKLDNGTTVPYLFGQRTIEGINFIVLNTAWNSFPAKAHDGTDNGYNRGKLYLGERIISNFLDKQRDSKLNIALFHHPLSWLHEVETRTYGQDQPTPISKRIQMKSDIILNGHIHGKIEAPDILANKTLVYGGGALSTNDSTLFQFEILSINKTKHCCIQEIVTCNHQPDDGTLARWEIETSDAQQVYFGKDRAARELFVKICMNEITEKEALELARSKGLQNFFEMYNESKFTPINNILHMNILQNDEDDKQLNEFREQSKAKSKGRLNDSEHNI